jgi:cytochrome c-type biogenesis protein CcmH/NrfF
LKPPLQPQTLLLWAISPAALLIGIIALFLMARRRKVAIPPPPPLSEAEQRKLSSLAEH